MRVCGYTIIVVIIRAGFQEVNTSVFRPKSSSKGRKLLESFHVSEVHEEIDENNNRQIIGHVSRETPGAISTRNNVNIYNHAHIRHARLVFFTNNAMRSGKFMFRCCATMINHPTIKKTDRESAPSAVLT